MPKSYEVNATKNNNNQSSMDNVGYQRDLEAGLDGTEMSMVHGAIINNKQTNGNTSLKQKSTSLGTSHNMLQQQNLQHQQNQQQPGPSCKPDVCRKIRQDKLKPPDLNASPWHHKKTIFLIAILVLFLIWVVVYTTLSKLQYF